MRTPSTRGGRGVVGIIARKELREALRDRRVLAAAGLLGLLYLAALLLGYAAYAETERDARAANAAARHAWLEQGVRNPHDAGHHGTFVFKTPSPLSIFEHGASHYMGRWVHLETHTQNDARDRQIAEATSFGRFGGFTPMIVLQLLLPLLILVLTHGLVSGEEESGTGRIMRATGVSPGQIFAGKLLGAGAVVALVVLPLLLAGGAALALAPGTTPADLAAAALVATLVLLYAATFVGLGLGLSALARSGRQALALSFSVWVGVCVLVPRLAASGAEALVPTPSALGFKRAVEAARDNKWETGYGRSTFGELYGAIEARLIAEQGVASEAELTVDPFGLAIEETEQEGQRVYDASYGELLAAFRRQDAVFAGFSLASPYIAMRNASAAFSATDLASHLGFLRESEQYRREMMRTLNLDIAHNARRHGAARPENSRGFSPRYERGRDLWESIPEYRPAGRSLREATSRLGVELVVLVAWAALALASARAAVGRRLA